jgi:lysophospholipase L1-like esterase
MNYFWNSDLMQEETILFIKRKDQSAPEGRLLLPAREILRVTNTDRTVFYEENRDFVLGPDCRTIHLTVDSRIPVLWESELRREPQSSRSYRGKNEQDPWFLYSEDDFFPNLQPRFTYRHTGWDGLVPESFAANLPETHWKLRKKSILRLVLFGDSISEGCNATEFCHLPPKAPCYGRQVADHLIEGYSSPVIFRNASKGGMGVVWGLEQVKRVLDEKPDLLILAWGMNDASENLSEAEYRRCITEILSAVRKVNPKAEFVLVGTKYANPEWTFSNPEKYKEYLRALQSLVGSGVALADLTSMWEYLLTRKSYLDLTGNGLNHPNDFGHHIYAQVITRAILG